MIRRVPGGAAAESGLVQGMVDELIPADVRDFILRHIDSVAQWEALLLLRANPDERWDVSKIARRLYTSDKETAELLAQLCQDGLLTVSSDGFFRYECASAEHRDIILKPRDLRELPRDIVDHVRLRFEHGRTYSPLQKLAYFVVFVILFPLIVLTGLTMSPGMDAAWPWLLDIFGGRQSARTLHFVAMLGFVLFFVAHIIMVVVAGPVNELRSMVTGYYRTSRAADETEENAK